jgi:FlaA1/EpsC-like NDP-sugar epimerase
MKKLIRALLNTSYLPSWLVSVCDLVIYILTFIFTYGLAQNALEIPVNINLMILQVLTGVPFFYLATYLLQPHKGIIRHSTTRDATVIIFAHLIITSGLMFVSLIEHIYFLDLAIPYYIVSTHYFISVMTMISFRLAIKFIFHYLSIKPGQVHRILIFGAGNKGRITREVVESDTSLNINLIGFIDDNWQLQGKMIGGLPVYSEEKAFETIIEKESIKEIIIAINQDKISKKRKKQIINLCLEKQIKVSDVPDTSSWINGSLSTTQIKEVQIEDLLGRDPIVLNKDKIAQGLFNKTILITGAAGSIGSELVRQVLNFQPGCLVLIDQAESSLFDLQTEIKGKFTHIKTYFIVGNVADRYRMRNIFLKYSPDIVFHAAAYKHVPMMEIHPYEAIKYNIGGIKVIADLSVEHDVKKFVMVSTDKAVNPTNVMGATKRVCEIYIQSLSQIMNMKTHFITTRFGNVLGSNGSVVPLFKKQISKGGPVTVTDKNINRYFMTIPEASQLVLEAAFMGKGGEIYLFDMGQPVQIYELAEKMILLSGYTPHKDIQIEITGLRPGEKLFEELLASTEEAVPSFHNKILIGKIRPYNYEEQNSKIVALLNNLSKENDELLVSRLKDLVPEYISNNSEFEMLDKQNSTSTIPASNIVTQATDGIHKSFSEIYSRKNP